MDHTDTTRSLSKRLEKVTTAEEAADLRKDTPKAPGAFHQLLREQINQHGLSVSELIARSGISRNYIYNILNGHRKNPGRDHAIALCVGSGMTFTQTNQALESLKLAPLYPKDERDVRIAIAINQGIQSVTELNLLLDASGLAPLQI